MSDSGSSDADEPAPSLKPTLSTLPLEIKARIAELSSLQDVRYKERWVPGAPGEELVKALRNEWSGRSLIALAQTCNVFNSLAAKHLFHTLHYTKFDSAYFSLRILPRHAHHIRNVIFDTTKPHPNSLDSMRRQLAVLSSLSSLSDLRLDSSVLRALIAESVLEGVLEHSVDDYDAAACVDVLRDALGRIESIELVGFATAESMLPVLELCPRINSIGISDLNSPTARTGAEALSRHLAALPSLRSLAINASALVHSEWVDQEWTCPVESLRLYAFDELESPHIKFIDRLAPTLRHLDLSFLSRFQFEDDEPPPLLLLQPLPSLHSLTLRQCPPGRVTSILRAVAAATQPLSQVHHLDVEATDLFDFSYTYHGFDAFRKASPNLRFLRMVGSNNGFEVYCPPVGLRRAFNLLENAGVAVPHECWDDIIVHPNTVPKATVWEGLEPAQSDMMEYSSMTHRLETRHGALKRALEFGLRRVDHMLESRDDDAMEVAIASLGPIWGWKLLEDD
ncbi:hypothetical protein RQP46_008092 [Phenoliferia psychrophenolica]